MSNRLPLRDGDRGISTVCIESHKTQAKALSCLSRYCGKCFMKLLRIHLGNYNHGSRRRIHYPSYSAGELLWIAMLFPH
jgi:hypothetical protein